MKLHIPRLTLKEDGVTKVVISMDEYPILYAFLSLMTAVMLPIAAVLCSIVMIILSFISIILAGTSIINYAITGVEKIFKK